MAEFALEPRGPEVQLAPGESAREISGRSPWRIAGRRLVRNRLAMAALGLFVLIVVLCLLAPFYANHIAKTDPFESNLTGTTNVNGEEVQVVQETQGEPGAEHPETIVLRQRRGLCRARQVDTVEAALAGASDGDLSVGQILDALALLLDRDRTELAAMYLPAARSLVQQGYLLPTD